MENTSTIDFRKLLLIHVFAVNRYEGTTYLDSVASLGLPTAETAFLRSVHAAVDGNLSLTAAGLVEAMDGKDEGLDLENALCAYMAHVLEDEGVTYAGEATEADDLSVLELEYLQQLGKTLEAQQALVAR